MTRCRPAAFVLAAAAVWTIRTSAAPSRTEEILARAGVYVAEFIQRFSSIVAEERFVQDGRRVGGPKGEPRGKSKGSDGRTLGAEGVTLHRELASDYLLVQKPGKAEWRAFRDVFQVDGQLVRDRSERLTELFVQPSTEALARADEIEREGARYNLGDPERTLNNPLIALAFLQSRYQSRFRFALRDLDSDAGPGVWILEFREQTRPTLLRRLPDSDLPARGRLWIEDRTGRVVKTELAVSDDDEITSWFRFDERFQIALPVEMRESYWYGNQYVTGIARYSRFRQFGVETEQKIDTDGIR